MRNTKQLCIDFIGGLLKPADPVPGVDGEFHGLYIIVNQLNMRFYIGKHTRKFKRLDSYFGSGKALRLATEKYGRENFIMNYFHYFNSAQELHDQETIILKSVLDEVFEANWTLMSKYCYNLKMNEGIQYFSDEAKAKFSGSKNGMYGNGHLRVGGNNPNFGRVGANAGKFGFQHSSFKGIVIGINSSQEVVAFNGNADMDSRKNRAGEFFQSSNISTVINGRQKSHRGFMFFRANSVDDIKKYLKSETFYDMQSREVLQKYLESFSVKSDSFRD